MLVKDHSKHMAFVSCGWTEAFYASEKVGYFHINRRMDLCNEVHWLWIISTINMPQPVGTAKIFWGSL